ncbi:MAG: hypothetical protein R6V76_12520, partial [Desulfobacterales bacterium]
FPKPDRDGKNLSAAIFVRWTTNTDAGSHNFPPKISTLFVLTLWRPIDYFPFGIVHMILPEFKIPLAFRKIAGNPDEANDTGGKEILIPYQPSATASLSPMHD